MRSLINDKGGFIQILLSPVIFAVAIILILLATLGFFFGSIYLILTNYILLTGIAFIGVFFVILIQGFKGKDFSRNKSIFLIITLFVGMGFILGSGVLQTTFLPSDRYVEIPYFASISCQQSSEAKHFDGIIQKDGNNNWITDNMPDNTNQILITLYGKSGGLFGKRFEYYICPQRSF